MKQQSPGNATARTRLQEATKAFASVVLSWMALLSAIRLVELLCTVYAHGIPDSLVLVASSSLINDLVFWLRACFWLYFPLLFISLISLKLFRYVCIGAILVLTLVNAGLVQYFLKALVPLGADLYGYSPDDIIQTAGTGGALNFTGILLLVSSICLGLYVFWRLPRKIRPGIVASVFLLVFSTLFTLFSVPSVDRVTNGTEFTNNLIVNKTGFFVKQSYAHFYPEIIQRDIYAVGDIGTDPTNIALEYVDEDNYPYLRAENTPDVLSSFINKGTTSPNVVIIAVEGLGSAFTNDGAYLGSFTPFLDSLSGHSLYWENMLSTGGRTFAVLPSILGSLPFMKNGFLEEGQNMPEHVSLVNILRKNGYHTSFFYGGDARFDNMDVFLRKNLIDSISDERTFSSGYKKQPAENGFSWGYGDQELFRYYFDTKPEALHPTLDILLTLSVHSPFRIQHQEAYLELFERRMNTLHFEESKKQDYRNYKFQYASILSTDDALRHFFKTFSQRADYNNTIFILTGDHRMPEIPMVSKIDRYHVPLLIYSPLLHRTARFSSVSSHFDIAPSLLSLLRNSYDLTTPSYVSWIGTGLDTAHAFRNIHAYPLMQTKTEQIDFISQDLHLNGTTVFTLSGHLGEAVLADQLKAGKLREALDQFKRKNKKLKNGARLIPDSIYRSYMK